MSTYLWAGACGKVANDGIATPADASSGCTYAGHQYPTGAQFASEDGCNTCSCSTIGNVVCTQESCVPPDADASAADASPNNSATYVAAASTYACAFAKGTVYCWGANDSGQLGNGTTSSSLTPTLVKGLGSGIQGIAADYHTSCAVVAGAAYCWGDNSDGTLGDNSTTASSIPAPVQGLTSSSQSIAAGFTHACAVVNGAAYCWGNNFHGQLGDNSTADEQVPVPVQGLTFGVTAITAGLYHTCAVVNGAAYCWGDNQSAQLGDGTAGSGDLSVGYFSVVPGLVQGLSSGVTGITAGYLHTCAVANGVAYCWGDNGHGQLGHAPMFLGDANCSSPDGPCGLLPVQVQGLPPGVESITAGIDHTCAVAKGAAYCWGEDNSGQLGDGNITTGSFYQPVPVQGLTAGVTAISAAAYPSPNSYDMNPDMKMTCAVAKGDVYCWGSNAYGQLGDGTTTDSAVPVKVQFP
jgi:alpha-tubulin suppressor-like RCC1 family protein